MGKKTKTEEGQSKLEAHPKFTFFQKGNKTLVIDNPTPKQLKRARKKKWVEMGGVNDSETAERIRRQMSTMMRNGKD